jgi:RNA polymerase sigma factor (sigma-70 family)
MAKKWERELEKTLIQALSTLEARGKGEIACSIQPILFENLNRGRIKNHVYGNLETNQKKTPADYVYQVAGYYEELCGYLYQVQVEKSVSVWKPLFEKMQIWAYNYLRRKNFSADQKTYELAQGCAASAGGDLVHAYFPYDIDFDAWAFVIVQNHCKKAIDRLLRAGRIPDHELVSLDDSPAELANTADLGGGQLTHWRLTLLHLIEQLPTEERETVFLYHFEGMTFSQIGEYLDIGTTTAYRRYFSAIDFLRENLTQSEMQPE